MKLISYIYIVLGIFFIYYTKLKLALCILWSGVMEQSVGVEWSQILEWQMLGTVLPPGMTEHSTIGKIDCSFDPGHV